MSDKLGSTSDRKHENVSAKLPKLQMPTFSGSIMEFSQFWSLFQCCVDTNESLNDITKLSYLLSLLKGDALHAVLGLPLIDKNYEVAKKFITDKFGKKKFNKSTLF